MLADSDAQPSWQLRTEPGVTEDDSCMVAGSAVLAGTVRRGMFPGQTDQSNCPGVRWCTVM